MHAMLFNFGLSLYVDYFFEVTESPFAAFYVEIPSYFLSYISQEELNN